ncbi:MAG: SUMF1/EgtB/PvdO family nonheme iron enzyme, partial [Sediminibacterium sp.]|nr:SUMF1/EgtB/PvdO family nonheme iron enzyme [Sediminibacterium sp.]
MEAGIEIPFENKLRWDFSNLYYSSNICINGDYSFILGLYKAQNQFLNICHPFVENKKLFGTPDIISWKPSNITAFSSYVGFTILKSYGNIKDMGILLSTTPNPTIQTANITTINIGDKNEFRLTNLTPNTTYYYRPFATNKFGTGYGEVVSFKTEPSYNNLFRQYTLTTSITNGTISPTVQVDSAQNYIITFTANSGYTISSFSINGVKYNGSSLGLGSNKGSYTLANIKKNTNIVVICSGTGDPYNPNLTTLSLANLEANMVTVPGGSFTMGATSKQVSDGFSPWWSPTTQQVILSTYKISKFEVTQQLWLDVMGSNPSYFTGNLQRPVENVTWNDCQAFITRLNQLTGKNYRLPTEAEWEYAARGGNSNDSYYYSGSDNLGAV